MRIDFSSLKKYRFPDSVTTLIPSSAIEICRSSRLIRGLKKLYDSAAEIYPIGLQKICIIEITYFGTTTQHRILPTHRIFRGEEWPRCIPADQSSS